MKFDRRIFTNLILFVLLIVLIAMFTMCQSSTAVQIAFADQVFAVSSADYGMNIDYDEIAAVELVEDPDLGAAAGGKNKPELKSGIWENSDWGTYQLVFNPSAANCIVVHTKSGEIYVFNRNTDQETVEAYEELLTHIQ